LTGSTLSEQWRVHFLPLILIEAMKKILSPMSGTKRSLLGAAALSLVLVLSGCGGDDADQTAGGTSASTSPASPTTPAAPGTGNSVCAAHCAP